MSRRPLIAAGGLAVLAAAMAALARFLYTARYVNPYRPQVERVDISLPDGSEGLAGMRIGFVTDTHVGPFISLEDLQRALDLVAAESPDLLLLGGDYASESPRYIAGVAERFGALAKRLPLGAYGVLGNHDYSITGRYALEAFKAAGIPLLRNDVAEVRYGDASLWIAGIDDTLLGSPDPAGTLAKAPADAPKLALWHEPHFAEEAAAAGAFAQLSGHTHGGQVRMPVIGPLGLPIHGHRNVIGLSQVGSMPVYTSRGVGIYRPPVRVNCPPEVTIVTLVSPAALA